MLWWERLPQAAEGIPPAVSGATGVPPPRLEGRLSCKYLK